MKSEEKKMKKVFSVLCAILIASSMVVSAFATGAVSSPSLSPNLSPSLSPSPNFLAPKASAAVVKDADGKEVATFTGEQIAASVILNTYGEEEIAEETKALLEEAFNALKEGKDSLAEIDPEYKGKEALNVMNISFSDEIAAVVEQGGSVEVETDMKLDLVKGTKLPLIRYIDGEWVASSDEYAEILEDGTVVLHVNQAGVFTLLLDPETEVL